MAWFKSGTISVTNGSATVTGSGTTWVANAEVGEALYAPDGRLYEITNIASDTSMTITPAYLGSTVTGQSYTIVPSQSYIRDLAAQAADLVNNYSTIANTVGQGKFGDGTLTEPGIRFSDDLDTGFFRSGANEVTFVAGGVAQFKYDTAGITFVGSAGVNLVNWEVGGVEITASGAELNILDGATVTTAELNVLDGITATTAELNILDGVTATASEINVLDGITATTTELNHTDGVTSNIQTQLDSKAPSDSPTLTTPTINGGTVDPTTLTEDGVDVVVQTDIGTAPNEVPLNQYLGNLAFQSSNAVVLNPVASAVPSGIGDMVFQLTSDTSLEIKVKGSDGTVRSVALTLA